MTTTERWYEANAILAVIYPASYAAEQNTGWFNVSGYEEIFVLPLYGVIGTSFDCDIEVAQDDSATGLLTLKSFTQQTADNGYEGVSVTGEDLPNPSGGSGDYDWMNIEATPVGATLFGLIVIGVNPKYKPVSTTGYDAVGVV